MLSLTQFLLDPLEPVKQGQTDAGQNLFLSNLDGLGVSLLSEATKLWLCQSEELPDEILITADVDVEISGAGGDTAVEVSGAVTVHIGVTVTCLLSSSLGGLLRYQKD